MSSQSTRNLIAMKYYLQQGNIQRQLSGKFAKHQKIPQKLKNLLETAELSDCEFIVGGVTTKKIKAHKLLLAMTSPVFKTMFYGSMPEENPIKITDIEPEIFQKILEYIYTDTIQLTSFDEGCHVYMGAKKYMIDSLCADSAKQMCSLLNINNACKAYKFAKFVEEPFLIKRFVEIFRFNTDKILKTDNYEDISLDVLKVISEQEFLNIESELVLFNALEKCVEQNISKSDSHNGVTYQDVLKNIRLLTLTPLQFATGPGNSPLLTENQKYLILKCITVGTDVEVPEGISRVKSRRN